MIFTLATLQNPLKKNPGWRGGGPKKTQKWKRHTVGVLATYRATSSCIPAWQWGGRRGGALARPLARSLYSVPLLLAIVHFWRASSCEILVSTALCYRITSPSVPMRFFWCRLRHRIWCRMESGSLKPSSLSSLSSSSLACCLCQGGGETTTWLAQWGNRLCEEAPAFLFSSALVVHALVPLSKALLSAPWGCCFVFVHIDVPLLPVWLLFTRFWWYGRLSVKLLLLRLFSSWLCSSPPFFLFIFDGMLFLSSGGGIFFFAMPGVPVYTLVSRDQKTKGPVCVL
jgi:hypothetical protein